jgi:large subunit ribosomal protein L15
MQRGLSFGKHGFKRPQSTTYQDIIVNIGEIDEAAEGLVLDGFAEKKGNAYHIDLGIIGIDKVLGSGKVTKSLFLTASEFSSVARQKIEEAKGQAITQSEQPESLEKE